MKMKKKHEVGTARVFISQRKAMNKLQLNLKDFRRLCILKGIYPREPNHIKKANKGGTQSKIFYHLKDINFLASEPLINKFREQKVFFRKLKSAEAKGETDKRKILLKNRPKIRLDHLVRERYPTFPSALQDLDDALCCCFAFSMLSQSKIAKYPVISTCKRLTTEFMHYVIESKALRRVFVSIKGIYYQAEIMGERITWVVGHERSVARANELDLSVMATFVDFYVTMLSFINFRLFKLLGFYYPPKLHKDEKDNDYFNYVGDREKVLSLAVPLERVISTDTTEVDEVTIDTFEGDAGNSLAEKLKAAETLRTLFSKFRFFLNREVPKECITFVVRSCGGVTCWDGCPAELFGEASPTVTHQIVDRPIERYNINRIYIQPQWVFDCFNARRLLPTARYAPGVRLPPHLSPFVEENIGDYVPPEKIEQLAESGADVSKLIAAGKEEKPAKKPKSSNKQKDNEQKMHVKAAKAFNEKNVQKSINEKGQNLKLREMMIPKRYRRVYKKIKFGEKRKARELRMLQEKRSKIDQSQA